MKGGKQNGSPALQECEAGLFELRIEDATLRIPHPPSGTSPVRGRVQIVFQPECNEGYR